jgi:hypothetical protein
VQVSHAVRARRVRRPNASLWLGLFGLAALLCAGCARSHSQAAAPQIPAVEFVGIWGKGGESPGQLSDPVGPAVDKHGRIYFASRGRESVDKFQSGGMPLLSFQDPAVRSASAIALDSGGGIYVADLHVGMVRLFFPEGDFLRSFRVPSQRGYSGPFAFTVDADGKVFVPDPEGGRIQSLSSRGALEKEWKLPAKVGGQPARPVVVVAADGFIYVADAGSGRILKYAGETLVSTWGETAGAGSLLSMAVSPKYLFVLRNAAPRLEVWTLGGQLKLKDNLGGRLDVPPASRASLAVTPQDELIVLDPAVPRVLRFRIHLDTP